MNEPGHRLYVRVYLTLLASLALAALLIGIAWHLSADAGPYGANLELIAEIAGDVLPASTAPVAVQDSALATWRTRTRASLALYSATGELIAAAGDPLPAPALTRSGWLHGNHAPPTFALKLPDARWLLFRRDHAGSHAPLGFALMLLTIAVSVGIAAFPMVRRLTRRLERLQVSVEALGAGDLSARVEVRGRDEVASLAHSFNRAAVRIEALMQSQKSLLANASHELRSPLARIRVAIELLDTTARPSLAEELKRDIAELDQLIEEILLASRLDAAAPHEAFVALDLTAIVAEECARVRANFEAEWVSMRGDGKLLRRLVRNLLDNATRYGGDQAIDVSLHQSADAGPELKVCDRGPGVAPEERENIFQPFYRAPSSGEPSGAIGLGLALVRQIAELHHGNVICLPREGGGSCFRVRF